MRIQRPRIPTRWRAGIRRGTARIEPALAFLKSPLMMQILREADERLRAWGVEPLAIAGVRQPFDYAPRITRRTAVTRTRDV